MTSYRLKAYIYLLGVAVIWGFATPIIKFTLGGIGPLSFLTYRFLISAGLGLLLIGFTGAHLKKLKHHFVEIFSYGFITTTLALGLLFLGLNKTTVLDTVLIAAVSPLVTAVAGSIFLKETITKQEKLGITLAFTGTVITILDPVFKGGVNTVQLTGNILVVGYLLANGGSAVLSKKLVRKKVDPLYLANTSFIIGFLTLLPFVPYEASFSKVIESVTTLAFPYHLGVLYMAIVSGTIAYALWIKGQKSIEISEAGVFAYLAPIFSTPLAVYWLGEKITLPYVAGAVLISIGVFIAEYKKRKKS